MLKLLFMCCINNESSFCSGNIRKSKFCFVAIVNKLNALLDQLHVPTRINTVSDIGAGVFVTLFEGLCGERLPGNF